jgi:RHS repeat-associated protein
LKASDTLGSVVAATNNLSDSGAVLGNQAYGPYGNTRYSKGSVETQKGFTGQISDPITGLDDYGARYYDPVVGRFVSAGSVPGKAQG